MYRGELVELKALDKANINTYMRWFQDADVVGLTWAQTAAPVTKEQEEAWFESVSKAKNSHVFAIHALADNRLIGNCGLEEIDPKNRSAIFGIVIGEKDYWGRGYGTDATRTLLRFAFDELNLHRVELHVFAFNERAVKAYQKAGFQEEGRRREAIFRHGRYWDAIVMGVLASEWRQAVSFE